MDATVPGVNMAPRKQQQTRKIMAGIARVRSESAA
jgi:hypothetical protein